LFVSIVELTLLMPHLSGLRVGGVVSHAKRVVIRAAVESERAPCSVCGVPARRVHSSYQRQLVDPAIAGREAMIELTVRRFFCDNTACGRKTFVEQVSGLTTRFGRRTTTAQRLVTAVAFALGGRAGSRLLDWLAIPAGRMTLIRAIRTAPEPIPTTPSALGVDDFALRRRHVYGTVLIDMHTRRPVDVLPDRTAGTLSAWLIAHPGVEVICRDRSGAYAEGASQGAPEAVQVADRWHLWHNLGEAVETVVIAHRADLTEPAPAAEPSTAAAQPQDRPEPPALRPDTQLNTRTRERYATIQDLLQGGLSRTDIARQLQLHRHTVRRFADATCVDELLVHTSRRDSIIDAFQSYLQRRWNEGCTDAAVLYQEIRQQGFAGSDQTVRRYVRPFRATTTGLPVRTAAPKTRHVARWIMTDPANLDPDDKAKLDAISQHSPAIRALIGHVQSFAAMMRKLTGTRDLPQWIKQVTASDLAGLRSFADGIQRDLAAVTNGLSMPYSSGPVEGHVNRIKMIKRQMYGRAKFDLLRRRVLAPI
jgi:transposase